MNSPRYPSLYQINTRVWLTELSQSLGRRATLDDIPDAALDEFARQGFDWIWLLSVWQTGAAAQEISRANPQWRHEFEQTLPDLSDADIAGSGFAITNYVVHTDLGGDEALARVRARMAKRGLRLMLDFVPNHMAPDHPWIDSNPGYFVRGSEVDLARAPQNYFHVTTSSGPRLFAHGRDPYFPGWPDTIQLNYGNPDLQEAMIGELQRIAGQCDGVRCDMAMLVLPEVFERTWGIASKPFWPSATQRVRDRNPQFVFMAEVYWDLEWTLQHNGFDYCYDKRLYDRLCEGQARAVREHFLAGLDYQNRLARFLENHDEPRAVATFEFAKHRASAALTFLSPGLRFFHQGEFEGRRKRISPHLIRAPLEPVDERLSEFYRLLLSVLRQPVVRDGVWRLLECSEAWSGNWTHDGFVAFGWSLAGQPPMVVVVNFSDHDAQCRVRIPQSDLAMGSGSDGPVNLPDLAASRAYQRDFNGLEAEGLYVELPAWGVHLLEITAC